MCSGTRDASARPRRTMMARAALTVAALAVASFAAPDSVFPVPPFTRSLMVTTPCMTGDDVTVYKNLLARANFGVVNTTDGCYDAATAAATEQLQRSTCRPCAVSSLSLVVSCHCVAPSGSGQSSEGRGESARRLCADAALQTDPAPPCHSVFVSRSCLCDGPQLACTALCATTQRHARIRQRVVLINVFDAVWLCAHPVYFRAPNGIMNADLAQLILDEYSSDGYVDDGGSAESQGYLYKVFIPVHRNRSIQSTATLFSANNTVLMQFTVRTHGYDTVGVDVVREHAECRHS